MKYEVVLGFAYEVEANSRFEAEILAEQMFRAEKHHVIDIVDTNPIDNEEE
jgi:hypothetical protein